MIEQHRHLGLREESKAVSPLRSATAVHAVAPFGLRWEAKRHTALDE
jgi:hypothetical protein